jgi:flagellar biosynthetic protein FliP
MRLLPAGLAIIAALTLFHASPALAQSFTLDTGGDQADATARIIQLVALLTVLSLAPSILIMMTSFTRIVVVLSFLRQAMGTQSSPPNTVIVSLALFLTAFVMAPTLEEAWNSGIQPYVDAQISEEQAFERTVAPVKRFMLTHVRDQDLRLFMDMSNTPTPTVSTDTPLQALIPAFMISELKRAFEIAFLLFVPFIIIDMVVASVLMSMGMMMLPPIIIALPFKLIFFTLVDGWYLVAGSLVQSFSGQLPAGGG